jgi:hypothetical protein
MTRRRTEIYVLIGLAVVLAATFYYSKTSPQAGSSGVFAENERFVPLDIREPRLHTEMLERLRKLEYSGTHRNIFVATAPPPVQGAGQPQQAAPERFVGPRLPPPPPPLQIPAEFFGYETRRGSGRRTAFFISGDDVLIVAEGDTFLGRYRLVRIGNDSADVEEIATGRHATVPIVQPPSESAGGPERPGAL